MRAKLLTALLAVTLMGAALWFAGETRQQRRAIETAIEAQNRRRLALEAALSQAERGLAALERERERAAASPQSASGAMPPAPRDSHAQFLARQEALRSDPEAQNRHLKDTRSRLVENYQAFGERLRLSDQQFGAFVDVLLKRAETGMDVDALAGTPGARAADPALAALLREADDALAAELTALLGEAGYRAFDAHRRTGPLHRLAERIAGLTALAGVGISGAEVDALLEAMARASPSYRSGGVAAEEEIEWDQVIEEARGLFSDAAFATVKLPLAQRRNAERLRSLARE